MLRAHLVSNAFRRSRARSYQASYAKRRSLYTLAISRSIPDSFQHALSMHSEFNTSQDPMSMSRARQQHGQYIAALRSQIPVLTLPADEDYPDCCFVEDTVIAIGNRALITRMGHASRRGEVDCVKRVLLQLGMDVVDMQESSVDTALCDGGDVMFTSRHLFIGLSDRTNQEGARFVAETFADLTSVIVPPIATIGRSSSSSVQHKQQQQQYLHLKSTVTHVNDVALLAPTGPIGNATCAAMGAAEKGYTVYRLPDVLSCNVVSCNGTVIGQDTACVESKRVLERAATEHNMNLVLVDTSELAKKDAALTCCSVLLSI